MSREKQCRNLKLFEFDKLLQNDLGSFGYYQVWVFLATQLAYFCITGSMLCTMFDNVKPIAVECKLSNIETPPKPLKLANDSRNSGSGYHYQCQLCSHNLSSLLVQSDIYSLNIHFRLYCFHDYVPTLLTSVVMIGGVIGAVVFGHCADRTGRKPMCVIGLVGEIFCNFVIVLAPHWVFAVILLFFIGFFGGGYMVVNLVLVLEQVGSNWRLFCTCINGWPFGLMAMALIGYLTEDWRWYHGILGAVGIPCLFAIIFLWESPRWLIQRSRYSEAKAIIGSIATVNRRPVPRLSEPSTCVELSSLALNSVGTGAYTTAVNSPQQPKEKAEIDPPMLNGDEKDKEHPLLSNSTSFSSEHLSGKMQDLSYDEEQIPVTIPFDAPPFERPKVAAPLCGDDQRQSTKDSDTIPYRKHNTELTESINNGNTVKERGTLLPFSPITTRKGKRREYTYLDLFRYAQIRRHLLVLCYSWFASSVISVGLYFNMEFLAGDRYLNTFLLGLFKAASGLIPLVVSQCVGRRPVLILFTIVACFCCWAPVVTFYATPNNNQQGYKLAFASYSKLNSTSRSLQSESNFFSGSADANKQFAKSIAYSVTIIAIIGASALDPIWKINHIYSAELFPTVVRNMARAFCNVGSRIGSVIGPNISFFQEILFPLPYIVFGVLSFFHILLSVLFLPETKGKPLPDRLPQTSEPDAQNWGGSRLMCTCKNCFEREQAAENEAPC